MPATPTQNRPQFDPQLLRSLSGLDFKTQYVVEGFLAGMHRSPFHGFSVEFSEYRDYQPGDDLRHLDWKLYARNDRLCIKRYEEETNARVYLVCDTSRSMEYGGQTAWASKMECLRILAGALAWLFIRQNDAVGLLGLKAGPGGDLAVDYVRPSQRPSQHGLLLRQLHGFAPVGRDRLGPLLQETVRLAHRRSILIVLSDLFEPAESFCDTLRNLKYLGHDCLFLQILDGDELDFPFQDASVFEDLETGARRKVSPAAARAAYLQRFNAHMEAQKQALAGLEMPLSLIRTDQSPYTALAQVLSYRARQL